MQQRLSAWGIPDADTVRYDRSEQDIVAGDQLRAAHGKGVRAILHAAFTIALLRYCLDRDIPNPGFVVLDSPLVTYRPSDSETAPRTDDDATLDETVVAAFYDDIQRGGDGQIIVMENTDPPRALEVDSIQTRRARLRHRSGRGQVRGQRRITADSRRQRWHRADRHGLIRRHPSPRQVCGGDRRPRRGQIRAERHLRSTQ